MPHRVYGLDIMRAAAILAVMHSHGYDYSGYFIDISWYRYLTFDGVAVFFVLSGFLIGKQLLRLSGPGRMSFQSIRTFWFKRWMRTLPAYFTVLILLTGLYIAKRGMLPPEIGTYFTFTQNLFYPHPVFFAEAWSLSVEEWFYLCTPLLFAVTVFALPARKHAIPVVIVLFIVYITVTRCYTAFQLGGPDWGRQFGLEIAKLVVFRADAIMFGVLGAWASLSFPHWWKENKRALFIAGCALLVLCNVLRSEFFLSYFHYTLMPIGALFTLPMMSSIKSGNGRIYRMITFISIISYSMYLTNHMLVQRGILTIADKLFGLKDGGAPGMLVLLIAFWTFTLVAAWLLYRFVEKPFLDLRDRLMNAWDKKGVTAAPVEVGEETAP